MRIRCFALASLLVLWTVLSVSCGGNQSTSPGSAQTGQILYALSGATVTTYAVDPQLATITPMGAPVTLASLPSFIQFVPSSDDRFLYILWSDAHGNEHLSEYSTDSSGVPQTPAAQVANVPSLSQLTLHPSGSFAYAMEVTQSSGNSSGSSNTQYTADIRLLLIEAHTGNIRENPTVLASYGPSYVWPASLFGLSKDGKQLYINYQGTSSGTAYRERSVNAHTGKLGPDVSLYGEAGLWNQTNTLAIGAELIIDTYRSPGATGYLDVLRNPPKSQALIHCTAAMLHACQSASNVQLHPSGRYLFLTDPGTQQIQVAKINLSANKIESIGASIPMTAQIPGFFFSPDGTLVYALLASDAILHIYNFDSRSGQLTDTGITLAPPTVDTGFCPAKR